MHSLHFNDFKINIVVSSLWIHDVVEAPVSQYILTEMPQDIVTF